MTDDFSRETKKGMLKTLWEKGLCTEQIFIPIKYSSFVETPYWEHFCLTLENTTDTMVYKNIAIGRT